MSSSEYVSPSIVLYDRGALVIYFHVRLSLCKWVLCVMRYAVVGVCVFRVRRHRYSNEYRLLYTQL